MTSGAKGTIRAPTRREPQSLNGFSTTSGAGSPLLKRGSCKDGLMDSLRAFDEAAGLRRGRGRGGIEVPPEIGLDERRMHVRAYNYWVSLLDGRPYPSIGDLEPDTLGDFGPQQRPARFLRRRRRSEGLLARRRAARGMRPDRRRPPDQRRAQALAALPPHRPLYADHRQQARRSASRPSSSASAARTPCIAAS